MRVWHAGGQASSNFRLCFFLGDFACRRGLLLEISDAGDVLVSASGFSAAVPDETSDNLSEVWEKRDVKLKADLRPE